MKAKQDRFIFKASLLSISLFLMMAPQIASALPLMYHAFKGVQAAGVQTLSTIPNFGIVAGLLISPFMVRWFHEKATIIIGLLVTLIAGTFPMYASAYVPILISRFLIGLGIGLFNSLAVSLIPQFYKRDEDELARMIGYQNVMGSVGAAIASFLVSYLVTISWHAAFAIYLLVIPVLILFALFVPLPHTAAPRQTSQTATKAAGSHQINRPVVVISILMFLVFTFYMPFSYELPSLIVNEGLGNASTAALIAGLSTLVSIPIGASFGFFFKRLHDRIFPLGFVLVAAGFLLIAVATNIIFLFIAVVILGFGFGLGVPYLYNWLDWAAPEQSLNLATTIVLVLVNIGCFVSPTIMDALASAVGHGTPRGMMVLSGVAFICIAIYAVGHYLHVHRTQANVAGDSRD
ncbi:MFS transporter [Lactiplantibacillus pentosus]|uniref:MFS transporter n=2 Tax=Lactiplantibacillus pentosus TaxID=1589 RepID=UPI0013303248|nr:MFS transporter [Lactiplantibacillus pentosus]MBQ0836931.1 MFS transporter [Lactiplantibacillus pentosus]MBU7465066.1 MFS transporter [Lactiplantibacillus pentosus]MBU7491046.1 MFS transporter [Lactiplantibacillus pentosus]MBU7494056.1 MFS transporter [Lactiplantibacillus pentosus]MBU7520020.1 MFS transporter [Lactiplantibacillus pentosus]